MELKDKTVVITGGSKGLGKSLAIAFIGEGSKVLISARDKSALEKSAKEIGAEFFVADVAKEQEMTALAKDAVGLFGRIDIWVNNAGVTQPHTSIEEIDLKQTHELIEVNLFGTIYGSRAAMRSMKKDGGGIILNVISKSALVGRPISAGYASSKWAARGFTESLRMALEPEGISVITVHPGGMKTEIFGDHLPSDYHDFMETEYVAKEIVRNLKKNKPLSELIVDRSGGV